MQRAVGAENDNPAVQEMCIRDRDEGLSQADIAELEDILRRAGGKS